MGELEEIVANLKKLGKSQEEIDLVTSYYGDNTGEPGKLTDPVPENTDSGSDDGSSVFAGTGWGKPTKFINTGIKQDEGRNTFKAEQTSTFENIPGTNTIPKIKEFKASSNKNKVDFYSNQLGDDGFGASEVESRGLKGIQITAPNKEVKQFYFEMPSGFESDDEGGMQTAGLVSLPVEGDGVSTEQDIADFINKNKLSKEDSRKLDNKRYKAQRFLNNNFVEEFNNVITKEELNGIDDNAISPIKALQDKKPDLFDAIRNNIMEKYEGQTGETLDLTNYQVESLFENVVTSKKNEQILASSNLLKTIEEDYKSGEYNYSWDEMVKFSTYTNVNNFSKPEKKLYTSIQKYKNGTLKEIQDLENHPNFDENSDEYKSLLKQQEEEKGVIDENLKKYQGDDAKFYVDYSTGEQVDQDFENTEDTSFEKYDITEEVENYTRSIVENAGGKDDKSFNDNLTMAYERDAIESAHFNSHNKNQNIDFTVSSAMHVGFSNNEIGFGKRLKRLGYDLPEIGGSIKNIPVNVVLDNWDLFKNHLDGAYQSDADDINTNYLGEEIKDWKDIGGYLKATKDMSISMKARDRAWSQLHLLNIDPSSYKRDKSDLYFSGLVEGLPWADATQKLDAKERIARNYRGGAMSSDQMITNSQNLIDEVNEEFVTEGIAPIKVSKKQIENLEKSRSEDFATAAGGFTPMVGEFFVAGGITNGLLKVSRAGQYLNKMKATTYLTSSGKSVSQASVATRAAKTGKDTKQYIDAANKAAKLRGAPAAFTLNTGKTWQKGLHLLTYSAIEEGKMQLLDPLFGTEMPAGSGFGFYIGGTVAKGLLPFKFGSQGSKFSQRFGRMANPVWEKGVKAGFGGAVAAEVALPVEQLLGGHKSWKRWHEETYPDMSTIERRFTGNLALFGAFGFQHFNKVDARFTVGMGKYYQNKWNKKATAFGNASNAFSSPNRGNIKGQPKKNTITIDGKEYTKEQADANYQKYLELSGQAGKYVNISEKVPEYQNPYEQKKMLDAQADKMNKDAIAKTGKPAIKFIVTTDGKNHAGGTTKLNKKTGKYEQVGGQPDAYFKKGKDGTSEIYIDARKVNDGQIPHEVYHHITNNHLKLNPEQNAAFGAAIQNYVQKALSKSSRADLDFMKFIEKNYGKEVLRYDKEGEIPANLIELLSTNRGYDVFVSNNLISDIAFEYRKLTEKIFTGADGKSRGGFAGKYLQPRLDLKDPATMVDYLARLASMSKGGEYNPNLINRLKEMLKDHRLGEDGKVYKKETDGFETIVSLSSTNIAKQIKLKNALKPLQDAYFAGKISREEYYDKQAGLRAALVGVRDGDETKAGEKPKYKKTIDETFSEGKERVNKNFHNHQKVIVPIEGYENLIPSEKKLNREYIFDMVETYKGRIVAAGKGKFDTPTYENMSIKEKRDFVFENTREELIKHIERFNPETAVKLVDKTGEITGKKEQEYFDIDGYINSYVRLKEGTAAKKNTKKFFSETLATEKANKIVDVETIAEVDLSKQIVLKDVLPLQPGAMETAKSEMLKGKDIEFWKRFLKIHPKVVLDKASDVEALTLKTIENVVPELIRDMYSSKAKIDAVIEVIESKELFINEQVKAGEMTPKRAEELKKQLKKSRKEIEAGLIAATIVDNIEAHKASVYSNVSEVTGMSTGLPNVMMSRKVKGKVEDVFLAKQKAGTKEGVKRVSAEMTTKTFDETGLKKKGNTAGNRPQKIIKLNNRQFLEKLGIKIEPGGEINIAEMLADRNILTSLVPALQNSVNKMVTNQLFESLAKEMKGGADIKTVNNLNRIITKAKSGRNFDLASFQIGLELFKNIVKENPNKEPEVWVSMLHDKDGKYRVMFPKKEALDKVDKDLDMGNQKKVIEISMKAGESDRVFEYVTDKHIKLKKGTFEIFSSYGGKSGRVVNSSLKELAVERDMDMKKLIIDKPLSDRNENHAEEYNVFREQIVEFMDPVLLAEKNVAAGTRYVLGEGQVQLGTNEMTTNSSGKPIRARLSAEQGKKLIADFMAGGEGTWAEFIKENPKYKNVNIKAMKVNDNAVVMEKHHELLGTLEYLKINEPGPKGDAVRMKYVQEFRKSVLAQKGFEYQETMLANDAMLEYFVGTVNKVHKHFVDKGMPEFALNFTQQFYQNQTSAGKGFIRGLASHDAVTTQRARNLPIKFKSIKDAGDGDLTGQMVEVVAEGYRSEHEFQAANFGGNMVVNHVKYHGSTKDFKTIYDPIARSFRQTIIPKYVQKVIDKDGNTRSIYEEAGTSLDMTSKTNFLIDRIVAETTIDLNSGKDYAGILTNKVAALQVYKNLQSIAKKTGVLPSKGISKHQMIKNARTLDKAIELGRKKKKARGISVFDFDETVGISNNFVIAKKGGKTKKIASNEWPFVGDKLITEGWKMDFSDFNKVTDGKPGPLMQKMKNQIKKFGPDNVFILTARAAESQNAIYEYLKTEGIKIPLKNITGLGNSTGEAKALWMLEKFAEGYNDMYFVDDAMPNVKAVRDVLNQLDIKSKVQQALMSKNIGVEINNIMEHSLDIGSKKVFSKAEAKVRGKDIKRRRVFMRDSAADLELLIEPLYGKGKEGIKNKEWFKEELVMPFERGTRDYNSARQSAKNDYMNLRKQNKDIVKEISKPVEGTAFTNDMAMRVYLWNKAGYKIPDLAKGTEAKLVEHIQNNPKLQAYAEQFGIITKQEKGLKEPGENWWGETMAGEVTNINRGVSRKQYLQEFIDVKNEIFTEENLNKMESKLGTEWRENITDMFDRMETGRTRSLKMDRGSAAMMNYLNGGIGTIMNFNTRSAVLQTISTTNFLNMRENNPIAAAKAMGNVKQFAKDFKYIMNSDMLRQRRDGLAMNVTEAEIASAAASSQNPVQSIISKVLKAGYLPTKMADSFAISFGGATFYRNRVKMYEKQGIKTKEAESKAFLDFQVIAERTQQSSRADLLSKQQTSLIGRFILPFANTPMQMNRAGMKDILDISKGRFKGGRELSEKIGRISYYMGAQVAIFAGLQSALFAMLLNDDDVSDEKLANTKSMMLNTTADSMLRGFGIQGAVLSATKNAIQEFVKQDSKPGFTADYSEVAEKLLNVSPPIGSKFGMLDRAGDRKKWAKIKKNDEFKFELGNPSLEASLMTVQAITNAPVYSPYQNLFNMKHALSDQHETWQRLLMASGWTPYSVGVETEKKKKVKKRGTVTNAMPKL